MKIFQKFTNQPKYFNQRRIVASNGAEYFLAHSDLSTSTPQTHFDFALESYSTEAQELIESIKTLMQKLERLMALCCETLRKEIKILSDLKELERIHNRQFNSLMMRAKQLIANNHAPIINEMSKLRNSLTWDDFLKKAYHLFDETEMLLYAMYQIINECKKKNIDDEFESAYLSDNDIKRNGIRHAIKKIDIIIPHGHDGKLPAFYLGALFHWCGINCDKSKFFRYFWRLYNGKYSMGSPQQFYSAISKISKGIKAKEYAKFKEDMKNNGFNC